MHLPSGSSSTAAAARCRAWTHCRTCRAPWPSACTRSTSPLGCDVWGRLALSLGLPVGRKAGSFLGVSGSAHSQDQWTRWGPAGLRLVTGTLGARLGQAQSLTICSTSDEPRAGVATSGPSPHLPPACTRGLPCTHPRVPLPEARADPALHSFSSCPPGSNQPTPRASGSSDCPKWGSWGGVVLADSPFPIP